MTESESDEIADRVKQNWLGVKEAVRQAAVDSGRDPDAVRIIGVSKYVDAPTTRWLLEAGCRDLGESRPQMLWQKAEQFVDHLPKDSPQPRWHMIGHVQTNKLRRMLRYEPLIHSVDSERLLRAIDAEADHQSRSLEVLLEVNISGDENKTGLMPETLADLLTIDDLSATRIVGLMAMAGWGTTPQEALTQFQRVAELRDELEQRTGRGLRELSMGMSGDFRQAIGAGATMVRIGSSLFEGVPR